MRIENLLISIQALSFAITNTRNTCRLLNSQVEYVRNSIKPVNSELFPHDPQSILGGGGDGGYALFIIRVKL